MTNEMYLVGAKFHIAPELESAAETALRGIARDTLDAQGMRARDIQNMIEEGGIESLTLDQLVEGWGWALIRTNSGRIEITGIRLYDAFSSDEKTLF